MSKKVIIALAVVALVSIGIGARLIDHPANFAPIGALALIAGFYVASRYGWGIAIGAMLISDLIIGFYSPLIMLSVYASYLAIWGLGRWARASQTRFTLVPSTLLGASLFFLLTNGAVWAFTTMYPKTIHGLYMSYAMGIPFFKWTLLGDVLYVSVFVAIIELVKYVVSRKLFAKGQMQRGSRISIL